MPAMINNLMIILFTHSRKNTISVTLPKNGLQDQSGYKAKTMPYFYARTL
jgi:hypothetical protein